MKGIKFGEDMFVCFVGNLKIMVFFVVFLLFSHFFVHIVLQIRTIHI